MRVKSLRAVIDADHAAIAGEIVLRRIKQPTIGRKAAMAVEMPPLDRGDDDRLNAVIRRKDHRIGAGPPGKGDRAVGDRRVGHAMGTGRQRLARNDLPLLRQRRHAIGAIRRHESGSIEGIAARQREGGPRRKRRRPDRPGHRQEGAAVDQGGLRGLRFMRMLPVQNGAAYRRDTASIGLLLYQPTPPLEIDEGQNGRKHHHQ